eukprot:EG_transcript_29824
MHWPLKYYPHCCGPAGRGRREAAQGPAPMAAIPGPRTRTHPAPHSGLTPLSRARQSARQPRPLKCRDDRGRSVCLRCRPITTACVVNVTTWPLWKRTCQEPALAAFPRLPSSPGQFS